MRKCEKAAKEELETKKAQEIAAQFETQISGPERYFSNLTIDDLQKFFEKPFKQKSKDNKVKTKK